MKERKSMNRIEAEKKNEEGLRQLEEGYVQEAVTSFTQAIELDPDFAAPYCHIGSILSAANQTEQAIQWFDKALELEELADAHYGKASALYNLEQWQSALDHYQRAEKLGLKNADLYYMIGMTLKQQEDGHEKLALAYFQLALDEDPTDLEALFQRGLCSAFLNHFAPAKQDFLQVLEWEQDHADAHYNLGVIYLYEEDRDQASEHFERALRIQPHHVLALHAKKQLQGEK
jgi:tetratricopeptide (TPR) repeat protein